MDPMDHADPNEPERLPWRADVLWQQLDAELPGVSVEVVARAESTNTQLIERARLADGRRDLPVTAPGELDRAGEPTPGPRGRRAGDTQPMLLVAEHQTRGRGRQGRLWHSAPGASLTFSLSLRFAPSEWSGLSLAVGVALAEALDPLADGRAPRIGLKWPNDLWLVDSTAPSGLPGRKLGGVLIETLVVGSHRVAVIGIGLNVVPLKVPDLATGYACLQELDTQASAPSVLHAVALPLARALRRYERQGWAAFADRYPARDLLRNRRVVLTAGAGRPATEGLALGLGADGTLQVRTDDGQVQSVGSGEVSVRPVGGAG